MSIFDVRIFFLFFKNDFNGWNISKIFILKFWFVHNFFQICNSFKKIQYKA